MYRVWIYLVHIENSIPGIKDTGKMMYLKLGGGQLPVRFVQGFSQFLVNGLPFHPKSQ